MQHFNAHNRHKIQDTPPKTFATARRGDSETLSELSRRGFHLVDMRGEFWTLLRVG
jgi:hypothetical protein